MAASIRSIPEILKDPDQYPGHRPRRVRLAKAELGEELSSARSARPVDRVGAVAAIFSALFLLLACMYAARVASCRIGLRRSSSRRQSGRRSGDAGPRLEAFKNYPGGAEDGGQFAGECAMGQKLTR
jgi:hypothetical protein